MGQHTELTDWLQRNHRLSFVESLEPPMISITGRNLKDDLKDDRLFALLSTAGR